MGSKHFLEMKSWEEAREHCIEEQVRDDISMWDNYLTHDEADLASLHSAAEFDFVVALDVGYAWLGAFRDPYNHSQFLWSDGSSWNYHNWAAGKPLDLGRDEDCVTFSVDHFKWNHHTCNKTRPFVCGYN